ncbi:hypothetical protein KGA66_27940 [Actinocrinis puniceicyclus]|uniref:Uncharacterized protein n=1 Tax=Actinocrinis puniceicyclus TaxID=977794 RepID=A0A8J7WUV8_9ACTN|nr:hypothetical protein [Actinocrinis puniceicyclus]MBS2966897.1 hypothetical protein [Actinocrinis puniceicyclus]
MSALALLPRFPVTLPAAGANPLAHRREAEPIATVPDQAAASIAAFLLTDHISDAAVRAMLDTAADVRYGLDAGALRPNDELGLAGVVLAFMAERIEHDPTAYPTLARAAADLVPEPAAPQDRDGRGGLAKRARRAAVEVLRPLALATTVRAATWDVTHPNGKAPA